MPDCGTNETHRMLEATLTQAIETVDIVILEFKTASRELIADSTGDHERTNGSPCQGRSFSGFEASQIAQPAVRRGAPK